MTTSSVGFLHELIGLKKLVMPFRGVTGAFSFGCRLGLVPLVADASKLPPKFLKSSGHGSPSWLTLLFCWSVLTFFEGRPRLPEALSFD